MQVGRNVSYERDGSWRKLVVSLNWNDLFQLVEDKKVAGYRVQLVEDPAGARMVIVNDQDQAMPTLLAYKILQAYCDILVWSQLAVEGGAAQDYARERIRECLDRAVILSI